MIGPKPLVVSPSVRPFAAVIVKVPAPGVPAAKDIIPTKSIAPTSDWMVTGPHPAAKLMLLALSEVSGLLPVVVKVQGAVEE